MIKRHLVLLVFIFFMPISLFADSPSNFLSAKKLASKIFSSHRETLYCQCRYDATNRIDLSSCGMDSAKSIKRANRMEWEHMMPAENFGRQFKCWQEKLCSDKRGRAYGGRKCCTKIDEKFKKAESELYNLWPSVGLINQNRSNYRYAQLYKKQDTYGCSFYADKHLRKAEPPDNAKGIVARANLFMSEKYNIRLSKQQRQLFESWNRQFPPSEFEKQWAKKVEWQEGYKNRYI